MNYEDICKRAIKVVKETAKFISSQSNKISNDAIETKSMNSFVTYVDKKSEQQLVDGLKEILPEAGFITEEGTETANNEIYKWIIDPLDGTTNFIHGLAPHAISVALMKDNKLVLGIIHEISLNECFYAWENSPAFLNGNEIRVSNSKRLEDTLLATGFPYYNFEKIKPYLSLLEELMKKSRGIRRLGSAATDLAYVACGHFDGFYEYSLNPWDVAAGAFIVQQAGGKICDFSGGDDFIFGKEIIASNDGVFTELKQTIKKHMKDEVCS